MHKFSVHDSSDTVVRLLLTEAFAVIDLSVPLLPLVALLYFLTHHATLRAKVRESSFARSIASESLLLATLLFLSPSFQALVGLETAIPIGLAAALWLWLSASESLTGFGLTMPCIETRVGRVSLCDFDDLDHQVPIIAVLFLLMGLASVGFRARRGSWGSNFSSRAR